LPVTAVKTFTRLHVVTSQKAVFLPVTAVKTFTRLHVVTSQKVVFLPVTAVKTFTRLHVVTSQKAVFLPVTAVRSSQRNEAEMASRVMGPLCVHSVVATSCSTPHIWGTRFTYLLLNPQKVVI
jgi:hypothetical protein